MLGTRFVGGLTVMSLVVLLLLRLQDWTAAGENQSDGSENLLDDASWMCELRSSAKSRASKCRTAARVCCRGVARASCFQ